jgi:hypothetical protein
VNDINALRNEGITAIKSGQRVKGRALLREVIRQSPNDIAAWLWLSGVVETDSERRECLERVLAVDPQNPHAKKGLQALEPVPSQEPRATAPPQPISGIKANPSIEVMGTAPKKKRSFVGPLVVATLVVVILVCVGLAVFLLQEQNPLELPVASSTRNPTPTSPPYLTGQWNILPLSVDISPAKDGWQSVEIPIALENGTGLFAVPDTSLFSDTELTTEEGFSYPVKISYPTPILGLSVSYTLPPGFRFRGTHDYDEGGKGFYLYTKIAQDTRPQKIIIPGHGEFDLAQISPTTFPGGETYSPVRRVGDEFAVSDQIRITVLETELKADRDRQKVDNASVLLRIKNLNAGYETELKDTVCTTIDDNGFLGYPSCLFGEGSGHLTNFTLGPNQAKEVEFCILVPKNSKNLRFLLSGDINEVIDTGY